MIVEFAPDKGQSVLVVSPGMGALLTGAITLKLLVKASGAQVHQQIEWSIAACGAGQADRRAVIAQVFSGRVKEGRGERQSGLIRQWGDRAQVRCIEDRHSRVARTPRDKAVLKPPSAWADQGRGQRTEGGGAAVQAESASFACRARAPHQNASACSRFNAVLALFTAKLEKIDAVV